MSVGGKSDLTVRDAALAVLLAWERQAQQPVDGLLRSECAGLSDERDHYLCKSLVYGVLQQKTLLDHILTPFGRKPLDRLKKIILFALRLGLYQLLFLDRIPPPIAVHETVASLKRRGQPAPLTGFANAVLRNVLRAREKGGLPSLEEVPLEVRCSHPAWLLDRWRARYGEELTARICSANNEPPPLVLRVNTWRISRAALRALLQKEGIVSEEGEFSPEALYLPEHRGGLERLPGFRQGYFQVQDEGAQLISYLLSPFSAGNFVDCCAGLGGKTSHLRQQLPDADQLTAIEPHAGRRRLFKENMERLGQSVPLFAGTLQEYCRQQEKGEATGALLDAPCSGLGVIRRHPEIRWNRKQGDLAVYGQQQRELLSLAASLLRLGGRLVYATCSTEPEENEEVVQQFLAEEEGFILQNASDVLPAAARILVDRQGFFRTIPGRHNLDGFFGAILLKAAAPDTSRRSR